MAVTLATRSNGLVTDVFQFDRSWAKQFNVIDLIKCLLAIKVWDKKYNTLFYWIIAHVSSLDLVIQREIWNPESSMSWVLSTPLKAEVITLEAFFLSPFSSEEEQKLHELWIYVKHTSSDYQSSSSSALEDARKGCISQSNDYHIVEKVGVYESWFTVPHCSENKFYERYGIFVGMS